MATTFVSSAVRSGVVSTVITAAVTAAMVGGPMTGAPVRLMGAEPATSQPSGTVYAMGGNTNPTGASLDKLLDGYFSTAPGTPFAGYRYTTITWPADIPLTSANIAGWTPYDDGTSIGMRKVLDALSRAAPGDKIVLVGYSSSAGVVTKTMRALAADAAAGRPVPSPDDLSFMLLGNPNRPNGGVMARFPGAYLPLVGITFNGATPSGLYPTTDVALQYDGIADFPIDATNMLAVANAVLGMGFLHPDYSHYDITDTSTILTDVTTGNTRYVTVRADRLPLLMPFYLFGFPTAVLDAIDPILRAAIETGYDRTTAGTPITARIGSPHSADEIAAMFAAAVARSTAIWAAANAPAPRVIVGSPGLASSAAAVSTLRGSVPAVSVPVTSATLQPLGASATGSESESPESTPSSTDPATPSPTTDPSTTDPSATDPSAADISPGESPVATAAPHSSEATATGVPGADVPAHSNN